MKKLMVVAVALILAACVIPSPEQIGGLQSAQSQYRAALKDNLSIDCTDKPSCDKAFSLVKAYINEHSDMRIQQSDDTSIATFAPVVYVPYKKVWADNLGMLSMSAVKIPGSGDSATIKLKVACSGLDEEIDAAARPDHHINSDPAFNHVCMDRMVVTYNGFKSYIESRLK